jgi:hypothetical protein
MFSYSSSFLGVGVGLNLTSLIHSMKPHPKKAEIIQSMLAVVLSLESLVYKIKIEKLTSPFTVV